MVEQIRVSIGSAVVLGLDTSKKFKVSPTTCYVMTYIEGHCIANCAFCPQGKNSNSSTERLSRINWPVFPFKEFITKLKYLSPSKQFKRICVQTLNYPENFKDLIEIVSEIKRNISIPISVAIPPMSKENLKELKRKGVGRVGVALDGATPAIFEEIKGKGVDGPYSWDTHMEYMKTATEIFVNGMVSTHLIIGLGETEKEMIELIHKSYKMKVLPGLFAFTPVRGTKLENLEQPNIITFRKIQLGRYLILNEDKNLEDFTFNLKGNIVKFNLNRQELRNIIDDKDAFQTSGCPGCNRPYYTSRPGGTIYNYPRKLSEKEKDEIYNQLERFVN